MAVAIAVLVLFGIVCLVLSSRAPRGYRGSKPKRPIVRPTSKGAGVNRPVDDD